MALCFPLCGDGFADPARVLRLMFMSMITGTNERARFDVHESSIEPSTQKVDPTEAQAETPQDVASAR